MTDSLAVVHEHYPEQGGAENVADELGKTFDAQIYTAFAADDIAADNPRIRELFADSLWTRLIKKQTILSAVIRSLYYQLAWSRVPELAEYEVLIQSGTAPMWYVPTDSQVVVRYIHTPPRHVYSDFQDSEGSVFADIYCMYRRTMRTQTVPYADKYVANSDLVARRIEKYWGVDRSSIAIVYPPVDVAQYEPESGGEYYIAVSRLVDHKRFEAIIDAFKQHPELELRIVGDGPERGALEQRAADHKNIQFEGYVSEPRKQSLLAGAKASLYNAYNEDFGIVPIESWAAGTPVIGPRDGFTRHQLTSGKTGLLFDREETVTETAAQISEAIDRFETEGVQADHTELHEKATAFSVDRFKSRMRDIVEKAQNQASIDTAFNHHD